MLDMEGHIDDCFESAPATRTPLPGSYVGGKWVGTVGTPTPHSVTIQPVSEKEIDSLSKGGERLVDARKIYVNDGDLYSISPSDDWTFTGIDGIFKTVKLDNRPWRNYCKAIVSRKDD